jgi:hypothetical protein
MNAKKLIEAHAVRGLPTATPPAIGRHLVIVPPVCGLASRLDANLRSLADTLAAGHESVRIVEFPGQNRRAGEFSIAHSCELLQSYVAALSPACGVRLIGLCSGAIACLSVAAVRTDVTHVFAWEVSPRYHYDRSHRMYCERRFGVRFCEQSWLRPIQPTALTPLLRCRVAFASGDLSGYCDDRGQEELFGLALHGVQLKLRGLGHFLSESPGRERLAHAFLEWSGVDPHAPRATNRLTLVG